MFRLLCLLRASGPSLEHLPRRMFGSALIAWLPLLVLAALAGPRLRRRHHAPVAAGLGNRPSLPRGAAVAVLGGRCQPPSSSADVVAQFRAQEMIPQAQLERFDAALRSAARLRDSTLAELLLDRTCLRPRHLRGLAQVRRSSRRDLVRHPGGNRADAFPGRDVAGRREPATSSLHAVAVVLPPLDLGAACCSRSRRSTWRWSRRIPTGPADWASFRFRSIASSPSPWLTACCWPGGSAIASSPSGADADRLQDRDRAVRSFSSKR